LKEETIMGKKGLSCTRNESDQVSDLAPAIETVMRGEIYMLTASQFSVTWAREGQAFLVASVRSPADVAQIARDSYSRIAETLREHYLEIVHERIFGSLSAVFLISRLSASWRMCAGRRFCSR